MLVRRFRLAAIVAVACTAVGVAPAAAQEPPRVTLQLNGAFQAAPSTFTSVATQRVYGEEATFASMHALDGGPTADVGMMLHLTDRLAIGAAFTWMQVDDTTSVTAAVPHPLDFEIPRTVKPQTLALTREERAVHLSVAWRIPLSERAELTVSGGPTSINVTQYTVVHYHVTEGSPPHFEQIALEAETGKQRRNAAGGHLGFDLVYMATPRVGVGYFVRFARATVELPGLGETTFRVNAGNVHTGAGLRLRF